MRSIGTAEEQVLGSILLNEKHMDEAAPLLNSKDFQLVSHQIIYQTMAYLYE